MTKNDRIFGSLFAGFDINAEARAPNAGRVQQTQGETSFRSLRSPRRTPSRRPRTASSRTSKTLTGLGVEQHGSSTSSNFNKHGVSVLLGQEVSKTHQPVTPGPVQCIHRHGREPRYLSGRAV